VKYGTLVTLIRLIYADFFFTARNDDAAPQAFNRITTVEECDATAAK
jgi:hypothetical protein